MDKIGEMLTILRNGSQARLEKVDIPASKTRESIAKILASSGIIRTFKVAKDSKQGLMRIYLRYDEQGACAFTQLKRVSTPGRRQYVHSDKIPTVRSGTGFCILSTNKGLMTGADARKANLGGELVCLVW